MATRHKAIRQALGGGYYVAININIVKLVGSYEAAALLTRAVYWQDLAGGEFYKTNEDWINELGISEWKLRQAKTDIAKYLTIVKRGLPAKNYYDVNIELIAEDLDASPEETSAQSRGNLTTSREETSSLLTIKKDTTNDTSNMSDVSAADEYVPSDRMSLKDHPLDREAYEISDSLDRLVYDRLPKKHRPKTAAQRDKAATEIERLHRIDGQGYELIDGIMRWSQQDSFWSNNILSTATLRKQFDKLYLKAKSEAQKQSQTVKFIS